MKKYLSLIIAAVLVLAGLIGTIVMVSPATTPEYKVIAKLVKGVNSCDMKKIEDCYPVEELSSLLGSEGSGFFGDSASAQLATKRDYLSAAGISVVSLVPEDAEVKKLSILTYDSYPFSSGLGTQATSVNVVFEVLYVDAEGNEHRACDDDGFTLVKTQKGYKIMQF